MSHAGRIVRVVGSVLPIAALLVLGDVHEGAAGKAPDNSEHVVAKVGEAVITVGELERRLGAVPPFQLGVYGATADEVKRNYLTKVLVPELLFSQGAIERGKDKDVEVLARQRELLKTSLLMDVRRETAEKAEITPDQILAYYKDNIDRYKTPPRVSVWRILVASREQATKLIAEAKKTPTPKAWSELALKYSLDKSTSMRGGNLGFLTEMGVSADGKTRVPGSMARAAFGVRDGEIVAEPVPEGSGFAVVWRRGSMPAINRTVEEEARSIEKVLLRDRTRAAQDELVEGLRRRYVKLVDPGGTELIAVSGGGGVEIQGKPGRIVRKRGRTQPSTTPRGLR